MVIIELSGGGDALKREEEYVRGIDNYWTIDKLASNVPGYLKKCKQDWFHTKKEERAKKFGWNFLGLCQKQEKYTQEIKRCLRELRPAAEYDWSKIKHLKYVARKYKLKDIERDINGIRKTFERKYAPVCRKVQSLIDKKEMKKLKLYVDMRVATGQGFESKFISLKWFRSYSSRQGKKFKEYIFNNGIYGAALWDDPVTKKYYSHQTKEDEKFVRDQLNLEDLVMTNHSELRKIAWFVMKVNDLKSKIKNTENLEDFYSDSAIRVIDTGYNRSYAEANKLYEKFNKLTGDFGLRVSLLKDIEERLREGAELYEPNPADEIKEKREKLEKKQRKIVANFIKKNSKKIQKVNELIGRDMNANGNVIFAIDNFDRATEEAKARMKDPKTNLEVFAKRREIEQRKAMRAKEEAMKTRAQRKEEQRKKASSPNPNNKARKPKEEERVM